MKQSIVALSASWIAAKAAEKQAIETRRAIEDKMAAILDVPETLDGTINADAGDYRVKIIGRIDRKVDADLVQEIAQEYGLEGFLSVLFRWKPEVNLKAFNAAPPEVTSKLAMAITAKPGRPSFSIAVKNEVNQND